MGEWFRVDNRLVHGQVIEGWLPYLNAGVLVVINDSLFNDSLNQQIMQLAIPGRVQAHFIPLEHAKKTFEFFHSMGASVLYLVSTCQEAQLIIEQGVSISILNIGNMHYCHGKKQICPHIAVSNEDIACFSNIRASGVELDFRSVPSETPVMDDWEL